MYLSFQQQCVLACGVLRPVSIILLQDSPIPQSFLRQDNDLDLRLDQLVRTPQEFICLRISTAPNHCFFNIHQQGNISFCFALISVFLLTSKKLHFFFFQFLYNFFSFPVFFFASDYAQILVVCNALDIQVLEGSMFVQVSL